MFHRSPGWSGVAAGRERVHIETVLGGRNLGLVKCATCGEKVASISQSGQCVGCEMKFARVDRTVLR